MQGSVADKILAPLCEQPVFVYSIRAFIDSGIINHFTIVYRDEPQKKNLQKVIDQLELDGRTINWTLGGAERQDSVYNALKIQPEQCAYVYIHDCARPLISARSLQALQTAVIRDSAAVLAHPVVDTIKRLTSADQLRQATLEDLERNRLWAMETPQAFNYQKILQAYTHVSESQLKITDDTAAAAAIGLGTTLVPNESPNPKITTPRDLRYAEWLLRS